MDKQLLNEVAANVIEQLDSRPVLTKLFEDYPEIRADADYQAVADRYVDAYMTNGTPLAKAITMAGEALAEKFGLGKHKKQAPHTQAEDDAETAASVVAEMRRSRPGSQESF